MAFRSHSPCFIVFSTAAELVAKFTQFAQAGRKMYLKDGTHDIGANILSWTFDATTPLKWELEGLGDCNIVASGTKVFDCLNAAFLANKTFPITLKNLKIVHNCSNATDVTLDLMNTQPRLESVSLTNSNATKQGTGFKLGKETAQAPTGSGSSLKDCVATYYGTSFDFGLDHLTAIHPISNICGVQHFLLQNALGSCGIYDPELNYNTTVTGIYGFYFDHPGSSCKIYNVNLEVNTDLDTVPFYSHDPYKHIEVWGVGGTQLHIPAAVGLSNNYGEVIIHSRAYDVRSEHILKSTGTGAQQTIPHTLKGVPTHVKLWDIELGANAYQSAAADATNIYVTAVINQDYGIEVSL